MAKRPKNPRVKAFTEDMEDTNVGKKLKLTIEWDGITYTDVDIIHSTPSDINPGDKTLPMMGEALERMMIDILNKIVKAS